MIFLLNGMEKATSDTANERDIQIDLATWELLETVEQSSSSEI